MVEDPTDAQHELLFRVYIPSYGRKARQVDRVGRILARVLNQAFGPGFHITDHRSRPVDFNPDAHDFGLGES